MPMSVNPMSISDEKTIGSLCCTTAPIVLSVTLDKTGYVCGERIAVRVNHGYRLKNDKSPCNFEEKNHLLYWTV